VLPDEHQRPVIETLTVEQPAAEVLAAATGEAKKVFAHYR
jgi:hypothetical protein